MLCSLLAAAAEAATEVSEATEVGSASDAINNALWQFPVAALVIAVVVLFLRYMRKERREQQQFLSETNQLDREDREKAQKRFTETLQAVQTNQTEINREMVDQFAQSNTVATANQGALLSRAVDAIDRNTEMFGEVKAVVKMTTDHMRTLQYDDIEAERRRRSKLRKTAPMPVDQEDEVDET